MSILTDLLRCGFVAAAFWTILAGPPAPAAADDQPAKTSTVPAEAYTAADREKLEQQMRSISEKIGRLEIEGKHDEAEKLKHEARALYGKLNPHPSESASPGTAERAQLYQQVRAIRDKINQATKDGNQDEVQRLNKEFEALRSKLYAQSSHGSTHPPSSGDREARLQHLRSAAENLKAAGFESEARHVMQLVSRIQAEGSSTSRPQGESTRPCPDTRQATSRATPPGGLATNSRDLGSVYLRGAAAPNSRDYGNSPAVQELRSQVEQMHRELRELREQLKGTKSSESK